MLELSSGLSVSRETLADLEILKNLTARWGNSINIVGGPRNHGEIWSRHIVDSAQAFPNLRYAGHVVDFGSGGGYPGLVYGVLSKGCGGPEVTLVESYAKKAAFLKIAVRELRLPSIVRTMRVEDFVLKFRAPDAVTCRAFAPITKILELGAPWWSHGCFAVLHKGRGYQQEIDAAAVAWTFDLIEQESVTEREARILMLKSIRPRT